MTTLQQFVELLELAHAQSKACDDFDVDSSNRVEWRVLVRQQNQTFRNLVAFCEVNADLLYAAFGGLDEDFGR